MSKELTAADMKAMEARGREVMAANTWSDAAREASAAARKGGGKEKQPSERVGQHADETAEWEKNNSMTQGDHATQADKNEKISTELHAKGFHEQGMVNYGIAKYHEGRAMGMDQQTAKSFGQSHVMDRK